MTYFNTTNETPMQCAMFNTTNKNQDELVLEIFKKSKVPMGASDVFNKFPVNTTPITSIRRSINTLHRNGKLVCTKDKKDGMYGRPEKVYKLKTHN